SRAGSRSETARSFRTSPGARSSPRAAGCSSTRAILSGAGWSSRARRNDREATPPMPMPDVLIIGAGVVGAACADALSAEGLRVEILESGLPGGGATAAAMGHLVVMDDSEAQFALTEHSRRLWTALAGEMPRSCEDERTGTLWIAADEEEMALVRRKALFYRERGVEVDE